MTAPVASGRVLATMNSDGSRRWVRPKPSFGRFWQARRVVAYSLIVMYLAIPHLRLNGRPLMLLDIARREFTLFGTTFLPTDTLLLMLLGLVSRISGDFLPGIQTTHYLYGAGCWIAGAVVWAACVLPRVLRPDPEA